jgi:hypothetical protein
MAEERLVCKHCGGDDFYADVEIRASAWVDSTGVWVGEDGKPHFEPDGRAQDVETWDTDYDIEKYVCNGCRKSHWKLDELVMVAPGDGSAVAPCGRCDHGRMEHPEEGPRGRFERGAMPCQHDGCDCHDYYDLSIAEAGQPPEVLAAIGRPLSTGRAA